MNALKNIVIIEDDLESCNLFKAALPEVCENASARCYQNVEDFIKDTSVDNIPSLIFIEINLPKINGFRAAQIFGEHEHLKNIPFIIFSNSRDESDIDQLYNLGASRYAIKPNSYDQLLSQLRHINSYAAAAMRPDGRNNFVIPD